jgi:hypothetical protein
LIREIVMPGKSAIVYMNSHGQTGESVSHLVKQILGQAGCPACGRLAFLHFDFITDPDPVLAKGGVTSIVTEGLAAK